MALSIKHLKVSDKADGQDPSLLQPTDWNANHIFKTEAKSLVGNSTSSEADAEFIHLSDDFKLEDGLLSLEGTGDVVFADELTDTDTVSWDKATTDKVKANVVDKSITPAKMELAPAGAEILYYDKDTKAPVRLPAGTAGMVLVSGNVAAVGPPAVAAVNPAWGFSGAPHAVYRDEKPSGTAAGAFTTGAWRDRVVNNKVYDAYNFVTLTNTTATNTIFTLGIGTWVIEWSCPAHDCLQHQTRLYNNTDTAHPTVYGTSEFSHHTSPMPTRSFGIAQITTTAVTGFKLQHRCAENGFFGTPSSFTNTAPDLATVEVYTIIKIWRIA